ncbi:MAG: GDSL-type esterase/lipase family protein [Mariprofundaceae bacterium]|nr:GDSL-type esterase/lipase family protein [Mariprofundaceae bacterium]
MIFRMGRGGKSKWVLSGLLFSALLAYAALAVHFRIFPFYELKAVKIYIMPDHDGRYYERQKAFSACEDCVYDIVMVGDSLIDHGDWGALIPFRKIANRGISGDDTRGVLERMDSILDTGARRAFIMLGINDIYEEADVDGVVFNYKKIIATLLQHGIRPVIQSTLYVGPEDVRLRPKITALNNRLEVFARHHSGVDFIDLNHALSHAVELNGEYSSDGLHLNKAGYVAWVCYLLTKGYIVPPPQADLSVVMPHCVRDL